MSKHKKLMMLAGFALLTLISLFNFGNENIVQLNNYINSRFSWQGLSNQNNIVANNNINNLKLAWNNLTLNRFNFFE